MIIERHLILDIKEIVSSYLFPGANNAAIELLEKMLKFIYNYRISIDECFKHPYLIDSPDKIENILPLKQISEHFQFDFDINLDKKN